MEYTTNSYSGEVQELQDIEFEVTRYGLKLCENGFDERKVLYEEGKGKIVKIIDDYLLTATDDKLDKNYVDVEKKTEVINAYEYLDDDDKLEYKTFVERIKASGKPQIKSQCEKYVVKKNADFQATELFTIIDNEDGEIGIDDERVSIETNLDLQREGEYYIFVSVCDNDGNISTKMVVVEVINRPEIGIIIAVILAGAIGFVVVAWLLNKRRHKKK